VRGIDTIGNYSLWEQQQGTCEVYQEPKNVLLIGVMVAVCVLIFVIVVAIFLMIQHRKKKNSEDIWVVRPEELKFTDPAVVIGRGTFGLVLLAEYRGTVSSSFIVPVHRSKFK